VTPWIIAIASGSLSALVGAVALILALTNRSQSAALVAATQTLEAETRTEANERELRLQADADLNAALAKITVTEIALATSDRLLQAAQHDAAAARKELTDHVESQLVGATPADLARIVDDQLSAPLPGTTDRTDPASPGVRDSTAGPGVSIVAPATADGAGSKGDA
jgi:hypothetical protein